MNIIFKKIRWKNFLSTGNIFTEVILNTNKTTLISGTNGAGKSTILDAIVFALYGKPFRKINKPQLMNSINQKDMLVELEMTIGKHDYLIRRGIKPNVFEVYCDGKIKDKANDQQDDLEKNILKMNYKSFTQIVILGSATYVPFMELQAKDRRDIIEDLLDIQIFSTMNLLLKEKVSTCKEKVDSNKHKIDLIDAMIESAEDSNKSIRKIRQDEVEKVKDKIREQLLRIEQEMKQVEEIEDSITQLLDTIADKSSTRKKMDTLKGLKAELDVKRRSIETELGFYHDHDNCPTCKQGIDHSFKQQVVDDRQTRRSEIDRAFSKLGEKISSIDGRLTAISNIEDQIQHLHLKAGEHRAQIKISKGTLTSCKQDLEDAQKEVQQIDMSKVEEYKRNLKSVQEEQTDLYLERETLSVVAAMLKDGGIKTRIIRQYIPVMNKLINKYLAAFDLFVDFQLDENFNEVIKSRFRDAFSYASFSEGEKLRINLAIMLTWRAVAKLRNSVSTNLLIMDETLDGALDGFGIENLIETLHSMNSSDNIFVISHRGDMFGDKFEAHVRFEKVKNFSQLAA
jgi:DNA repair exonuclease SbcCD ATPase subunit